MKDISGYDPSLSRGLGLVEAIHETPDDLHKERQVAEAVRLRFGWEELQKLPSKRQIDFCCLIDAKIVAYLEIKCRNIRFGQYSDLGIAADKYLALLRDSRDLGVPGYLAISTLDGIYVHEVKNPGSFVKYMGGRTDRSNRNDQEDMVGIPWEEFQ